MQHHLMDLLIIMKSQFMWNRPCFWPKLVGNLMEYRNKPPGWTSKFPGYAGTPFLQQTAGLAFIIWGKSSCFFVLFCFYIYIFSKHHISQKFISTISHVISIDCRTSSSSVLVIWTSSWLWASACLSLASKSAKAEDGRQVCTHVVLFCIALQHCIQ